MSAFSPPEIVDNLILRVEDCEGTPHSELEAVGPHCPGLWSKDYDVFSITCEQELHAALLDAARIASEVSVGKKFIFLEPAADVVLRLPPPLLKAMADAGCTLEFFCEATEYPPSAPTGRAEFLN